MAASSLRLSPLLSTQEMITLSPIFAPAAANLNAIVGFLETAGPHCADNTGFAVASRGDTLNVIGRNKLAVSIFAQPGFHLVRDKHANINFIAHQLGTNSHWIRHDFSLVLLRQILFLLV
jgi:hypothetical protein